jgi:hypothetical protein
LLSVTSALSEQALQGIIERDAATEDGLTGPDYRCAEDRHVLLVELNRLRAVVGRLHAAQPVAQQEGPPWLSE